MDQGISLLRLKRGQLSELARSLGISKSAVSMWKRVPADKAVAVERITGIHRHTLRPDVFTDTPDYGTASSANSQEAESAA